MAFTLWLLHTFCVHLRKSAAFFKRLTGCFFFTMVLCSTYYALVVSSVLGCYIVICEHWSAQPMVYGNCSNSQHFNSLSGTPGFCRLGPLRASLRRRWFARIKPEVTRRTSAILSPAQQQPSAKMMIWWKITGRGLGCCCGGGMRNDVTFLWPL